MALHFSAGSSASGSRPSGQGSFWSSSRSWAVWRCAHIEDNAHIWDKFLAGGGGIVILWYFVWAKWNPFVIRVLWSSPDGNSMFTFHRYIWGWREMTACRSILIKGVILYISQNKSKIGEQFGKFAMLHTGVNPYKSQIRLWVILLDMLNLSAFCLYFRGLRLSWYSWGGETGKGECERF